MDPLSISTAALGLVQTVTQVVNYLQDVKNAQKERIEWIGDLEALNILLKQFRSRLNDAKESPSSPWYRGFLEAVSSKDGKLKNEFDLKDGAFNPDGLLGRLQERVLKLKSDLQLKPGWHGAFQRAVHTIDKVEFAKTFAGIRALKSDLATIMELDHFTLSLNIYQKLEASELRAKKADRMEIIKWLSPLEFLERQRKINSECFYNELSPPGQWLLDSDEFVAWKSGRSWPLYCYGNPGAGKVRQSLAYISIPFVPNRSKDCTLFNRYQAP